MKAIKQEDTKINHWIKYSLLLCLFTLVFITFWMANKGHLTQIYQYLMHHTFEINDAFLDDASSRAEAMTILLAELHAGLLVLQSSEFGINFFIDANIQLGNIIAQLTEIVSYGRNFALLNLVILHIIDNLLLFIRWLSPWLLIIGEVGLLAVITSHFWIPKRNHWHAALIRFGESIFILVILLTIILPLTIYSVSYASKSITQDVYHSSYQATFDTKKHLLGHNLALSIKEDTSSYLEKFRHIKSNISEKASYLANNISLYIGITILEVFILPIIFCLLMFLFIRALIKKEKIHH